MDWLTTMDDPPQQTGKRTSSMEDFRAFVAAPHTLPRETILSRLNTTLHGLTHGEAAARLGFYGHNTLPRAKPTGLGIVFIRQFANPLIYILLAAAVLSLVIREWSDAVFIFAVLMINALIGTVQEFSAQRSAAELHKLVTTISRVAGLGLVELEAMQKAGYGRRFSAAITAASSTIGPVVPPSIPFVIYGSITGESVGRLFLSSICISLATISVV